MDLGALIDGLNLTDGAGNALTAAALSTRVCDITEDSRTVLPGSLFIARAGLKADGKKFVDDAVRAGACAILTDDPGLRIDGVPVIHARDVAAASGMVAERFYGRPAQQLRLAGVTGTNGKTTITYLVWSLLNSGRQRCGLIGTVLVDDGSEVAQASMTTPPAVEVSRTLGVMVESGCVAASMEVSSHALDQKRCDALGFRVAVFTNLTGDHLDYHKTMDNYAAAKARLFELLAPDGLAVVNATDPYTPRMVRDCRARVVRTAVVAPEEMDRWLADKRADAAACVVEESVQGTLLRLAGPWGDWQVRVGLIGRYNAMNVLQACVAAHALGLSAESMRASLPNLQAPPGRLERVSELGDAATVFVDYAHSDDSLANVLQAVGHVMPGRGHAGGAVREQAGAPVGAGGQPARLWAVFGCGGDRDKTKRPRMGLAAATHADMAVVTSDNPRTERPGAIVDEILAGIPEALRGKVAVQVDRERAIRYAIEQATRGDVVVIAGKGHETEQILPDGSGGTIKTHFDDREVARVVLAERRASDAGRKPAAGAVLTTPGGQR